MPSIARYTGDESSNSHETGAAMKLSVILASGCIAATAALAGVANAVPITGANFTPPPKGAKPVIAASFRNATPVTREVAAASINAQRRAQAVTPDSRTVDLATTTEANTLAGQ
jgi:hypothetical protein